MNHPVILSMVFVLCGAACADDGQPAPDIGAGDLARADLAGDSKRPLDSGQDSFTTQDVAVDALAAISEKEPNNGAAAADVNDVPVPALIKGAVGTADDVDLFAVTASAGDRLVASVQSGGPLQAHVTIFDPANKLPTAINHGPGHTMVEYYALKAGPLLIGVRDRRNVGSGSQHVGGATFTYTLSVLPLKRAPISVAVGAKKSASLAPRGTARVFAFSANKGDSLSMAALAKQLSPPSDVDTRLSLFHVSQKLWYGTNDDASTGVSDSLLKSNSMPLSGVYHAIVENVDPKAVNLGIALEIKKL